jgi:hypothetical protein
MNSQIRLKDLESGEVETYTLVYPDEANADENKISVLATQSYHSIYEKSQKQDTSWRYSPWRTLQLSYFQSPKMVE